MVNSCGKSVRLVVLGALAWLLVGCDNVPDGLKSLPETPSYTGTLTTADPRLDDGTHFHLYSVFAESGDRIRVSLTSDDFDPYLIVRSPSGRTWEDDDGGRGNNAFLDFTADIAGRYIVVANSYQSGQGDYQVWIDSPGDHRLGGDLQLPEQVDRTIPARPVQSGRLSSSDPQLEDRTHYHCYVVEANAGDRITVSLTSSDFDAYLLVRSPSGTVQEDDDSGAGTSAYIEIPAADASGTWQIFVNTVFINETGAYELRVNVRPTDLSGTGN